MSLRILIDVNLSTLWCDFLGACGWEALHWTTVGDPRAPDTEIMRWARAHGYIVLTHDLDFGTILALTFAEGPSVVQLRIQDNFPANAGDLVDQGLREFQEALESGALVVVDGQRLRARMLPISVPDSIP